MEYLICLVPAALIAEWLLNVTWNRWYVSSGPVLFRHTVHTCTLGPAPDDGRLIEKALPKSRWVKLTFRRLDHHLFAFREAFWGGFSDISYTRFMRGLLEYEVDGSVTVTGRLNGESVVTLVLLFLLTFMMFSEALFLRTMMHGLLFGYAGLLYIFQARRFREVAEIAATLRTTSP
jgi:hypothetical protein